MNLEISGQIFKNPQISNVMKIHQEKAELFLADRAAYAMAHQNEHYSQSLSLSTEPVHMFL